MEVKPYTLEHFILYAAYTKTLVKMISKNVQGFVDKGILDEPESALADALLLGLDKADYEFSQLIEHCLTRTDKGDHLALALVNLAKQEALE